MEPPKVGELFKQAWEIFKQKIKPLVLIQLPSFVVGTLFGGFIGFAGFVDVNGRFVMPAVWDEKTIAIASIGGVLAIATLVVSIWTQMATMVAIKDLDTVLSFREAYKQSSGLILSSLVISILTGLALMGGFILLEITFWSTKAKKAARLYKRARNT